jgi:branched-chain amino acid transport system ATP-binding protein
MNTGLLLENVTGYYGPVPAVRNISLTIRPQEAVGISGPNGAGKTTLLRAICGLVRKTGKIRIDGKDISSASTVAAFRRYRIVYVPQERMVIGGLSVIENLRIFWSVNGPRTNFGEKVQRVTDFFPELKSKLQVPAAALSGGERQMLALSRILFSESPNAVLLDEPSAGLAPKLVERISRVISELLSAGQFPMLLVEQNDYVLKSTCQRIEYLAGGELAAREQVHITKTDG